MSSSSDIIWAPVLQRSVKVSLVVGTLLNVINQPEFIFVEADINLGKALLTYLVPFCVSTYGAYTALLSVSTTNSATNSATKH